MKIPDLEGVPFLETPKIKDPKTTPNSTPATIKPEVARRVLIICRVSG